MQKVTAAILIKDNKILIGKRPAASRLPNMWELPGGKVENGETPEACLKREMAEEFGIAVAVGAYFDKSIYTYSRGKIVRKGANDNFRYSGNASHRDTNVYCRGKGWEEMVNVLVGRPANNCPGPNRNAGFDVFGVCFVTGNG